MFSNLNGVQMILIGLGMLCLVMAVSAIRRDTRVYQGPVRTKDDDDGSRKSRAPSVVMLPQFRSPARERDYYAMEETSPGVSAGELVKTAKVAYIHDFKPPQASA
jgi:hypothetical protein